MEKKIETEYHCVAHDHAAVYSIVHVKRITCLALAQIVTGSNFEMAIAVLSNVFRAGSACSRQLSGRS